MSTYDGAYQNRPQTIYPGGWNDLCVCDADKVNTFCSFHGERGKQRVAEYREERRRIKEELEGRR